MPGEERTDAGGRSARRWAAAGVAALLGSLLADVLIGGETFAWRDTAFFYRPLFDLVQAEWAAGRVPLWNPHEGAGTPLLASPTAAVLYPGKLLFALPFGVQRNLEIYVVAHLVLAAWSAGFAARRLGASLEAAGVAAAAYATCGVVLFQHTNVAFLCGAAWLPLALAVGERALRERSPLGAVRLGAVLALQTLAGDPQAAYVSGLLVALLAILRRPRGEAGAGESVPRSRRAPALLTLAALATLCLAAAQVLPTAEFAARSSRSLASAPRSLWDVPSFVAHEQAADGETGGTGSWWSGLVGRPPPPANHHEATYRFSLAPWRLAELVWPNASGRTPLGNRSWTDSFAPSRGEWVPSLYAGLLPLLLVLVAWRARRDDVRVRWLALGGLGALAASLGSYGPVWLARAVAGASPGAWPVGDEVGGPYWLLATFLPGFAGFRYPAKLLVVAAAAGSLLAARGWDRAFADGGELPRRGLRVVAALSALALALWIGGRSAFAELVADVPAHYQLGPLQVDRAWTDVLLGLSQALVVSGLLLLLFRRAPAGAPVTSGLRRAAFVLVLLDLAQGNAWMLITTPRSDVPGRSSVAERIERAEAQRSGAAGDPARLWRVPDWAPPDWSRSEAGEDRPGEILRWSRDSLFQMFPLEHRLDSAGLPGTIALRDVEVLLGAFHALDQDVFVRPRRGLDLLGARYLILPRAHLPSDPRLSCVGLQRRWSDADRGEPPTWTPRGEVLAELRGASDAPEDVRVLENVDALPRAWIVHDVHVRPEPDLAWTGAGEEVVRELLYPTGAPLDPRRSAVVEDDALHASGSGAGAAPAAGRESCDVLLHEPDHVVVEAVLSSRGLVVLADAFYPGWELEVASDGGPPRAQRILRTNRALRGALLDAGQHRLTFRYRPDSFRVGAALSGLAWLALAIASLRARRRRRS